MTVTNPAVLWDYAVSAMLIQLRLLLVSVRSKEAPRAGLLRNTRFTRRKDEKLRHKNPDPQLVAAPLKSVQLG